MTTPTPSAPSSHVLEDLAARLAAARPALAAIPDDRLLAAWGATVEAFLDPGSPERRAIQGELVRTTGLSPEGLEAGLEAVLGGVRIVRNGSPGRPVEKLFAEARALREGGTTRAARPASSGPDGAFSGRRDIETSRSTNAPGTAPTPVDGFALVVLASNLPALAVQPLVAALAARRPVLLKSPTAEPVFAPAFVRALTERLPALGDAVAAVTWPGGAVEREAPVLARASVVVAYGGADALEDLAARTAAAGGARFVPYGPKTSLAVIGLDAEIEATAAGLARDVALFDQRGCLSVVAVYVEEEGPASGPSTEGRSAGTEGASDGGRGAHRRSQAQPRSRLLADALAAELRTLARRWPPGPIVPADAAAVQQVRTEAELRGLYLPGRGSARQPGSGPGRGAALALREATVVVEPEPAFHATPGLRTVRIHPLPEPLTGDRLEQVLAPWAGRLQGVALSGFGSGVGGGGSSEARAEALRRALDRLGVSRIAPPGALQSPDARWHNGGVDPLRMFL